MTRFSTRLAWLAAGLAAVASAAGLFAGVYRDVPAMADQARAADLATLFVAVPLLVIALLRGWRITAMADVAYLAYTYAIFSFEVVLNPMAPVYIAVLSLSVWSLVFGVPTLQATSQPILHLPRRTTAAFLALVAVLFAGLWLSDIVASAASGALPASVTDLGVPTSAVYALDLGFVLPLFLAAAVLVLRRSVYGGMLALGSLVFLVLMALSILPIFAIEAADATLADPTGAVVFAAVGLGAIALAATSFAASRSKTRLPASPATAH